MDNDWIKDYRKSVDWWWYKDIPTCHLFFHLLRRVNWKPWILGTLKILPWEIITSSLKLAEETGLSRQQVRTALEKLVSTNDITMSATKSYTHIKVKNWCKYQQEATNTLTNEQPTSNQPITTIEEGNKERKKEDTNTVAIATKNENEIFFETIQTDINSIIDTMNITEEQYENARRELFKFWNYWTEKDMRGKERWRKEKTFEVKRRLTTWLLNNKFNSNQKTNGKRFAD